MSQKKEIESEILEQLLKKQTSKVMMFQSFSLFRPTKSNCIGLILIVSLSLIPSVLIGVSLDTIALTKATIETINQVIIALLGIIFTGYTFFQALINKELLIWMLGTDDKEPKNKEKISKSRLQISNEYFIKVMMLQSLSIIIGLFIGISLSAIPEDWYLFSSYMLNNVLSVILLWFYFSFNFLIVWEIKSFVFNLYQLFNAYSVATVLSMFDDDENEGNRKTLRNRRRL